jgi:hypothetical protein
MNPNFDFFLTAKIRLGSMDTARADRGTMCGLLVNALEQETGKRVKDIKFDYSGGGVEGITVIFDKEENNV